MPPRSRARSRSSKRGQNLDGARSDSVNGRAAVSAAPTTTNNDQGHCVTGRRRITKSISVADRDCGTGQNTNTSNARGSQSRSKNALRGFWPILGPLLVSFAMIGAIIWTSSNWLDKACDQATIETTSRALSHIIQVDICQVVTKDRGPPNQTSSGLAVIQEGEAIGQAVHDLVDSAHDAVLYARVAKHVYETTGDMAVELQSLWLFSQGEALGQLIEAVDEELDRFLTLYTDFEIELKAVVSTSVARFRMLSLRLDNPVHTANNQPAWRRVLDSWMQDGALRRWYHRFNSESALVAALAKATFTLVPRLETLYRTSDRLLDDLKNVVAKLTYIKTRLHDQEKMALKERSGQQHPTWLTSWMPSFQVNPAWDNGALPQRCHIPLRKYIDMVDEQLVRVTNHITQLSTVQGRFGVLGKSLLQLKKTTDNSRGLTFSQRDRELAQKEVAKLQLSFEEMDRKWKGLLLESGPPLGTVKQLGRT